MSFRGQSGGLTRRKAVKCIAGLWPWACCPLAGQGAQAGQPRSTWLPARSQGSRYNGSRLDFTVGQNRAFLLLPAERFSGRAQPWIWYAPTFYGKNPDERHAWMFTRLLEKRLAIAGVDVGESWGNPEGRRVYTRFHARLVEEHGLSPKACLLPISRGGLMLYNWAAENPRHVQCIGGIYPFVNLLSFSRGLADIANAYSMNEADFRAKISLHNPIDNLRPLAERRVPILHLHGEKDTVLPFEQNSGELGRRYAALGARAEIVIIYGKGHEVCPEFWESRTLVDFLISRGLGS